MPRKRLEALLLPALRVCAPRPIEVGRAARVHPDHSDVNASRYGLVAALVVAIACLSYFVLWHSFALCMPCRGTPFPPIPESKHIARNLAEAPPHVNHPLSCDSAVQCSVAINPRGSSRGPLSCKTRH